MDEFIVVGHKIKKEDPHASINIEEKIDAGQLHTAADILENVPGMVVSRGQNSGIQVGMRGLNHERTVIAINGNVVDNIGEIMQGRALEWDALPITNIKQMQIIRGGRSAMYGGALAGVINIITDDDNIKPESKLRFSYGSWNTWKSTFSNQGKSDNQKLSWSLALSKQESDGYYRNTSSNGHDGSINLSYNLNDTDKIRLLYSHVYKREGMAVGNNKAKIRHQNTWVLTLIIPLPPTCQHYRWTDTASGKRMTYHSTMRRKIPISVFMTTARTVLTTRSA